MQSPLRRDTARAAGGAGPLDLRPLRLRCGLGVPSRRGLVIAARHALLDEGVALGSLQLLAFRTDFAGFPFSSDVAADAGVATIATETKATARAKVRSIVSAPFWYQRKMYKKARWLTSAG
jgi:hypothetical protein